MKFLAAVGVLVLGFVSATSSVAAGRHPTTGAWPDTDFVDESTLKVSIGSSSAVLPSSSQCVSVPGTSVGDVAVVNITNTNATGRGWGALRASGTTPVFNRPLADQYSSVNFAANTPPNPNLAVSPVGADGKVCYDGAAASHNVILDLSAVIPAGNVNAIDPERILDTRGKAVVLPSSSQCVSVPGTSVGDVAVVNITNTNATGRGWGALRASGTTPVFNRPLADQYSSVNFAANTPPNPNLAVSPVGADGKVCYDGAAASHNVILDLSAVIPAGNVNAIDPERILDTRPNGAVLTSCEGTDTSVIPGRLAQPVVCSFPWGLAESTDFIGSGPTVIVTLLNTIERRAIRSWWQVEDGPAASGYTVDAIVGQGIPRAAAQLLFDALDACSGCAYRNP